MLGAIRKVASGRPYISTEVAEQLALNLRSFDERQSHKRLTNREFEVFIMLVSGKSNTEIGNALHLSIKTVSTHKTNIMEKMGLKSVSALVHYAIEHNLISRFQQ